MKNPPFSYHRPSTLVEALALLDDLGDDAKVMSGGQSLLPVMAIRLSHPEHIVDISRIDKLGTISLEDDVISIGAGITHSLAEKSDIVANGVPMLARAIPYIGHRAIRNRGTICGSLAHADPAAELPAVALALGAEIVAESVSGSRTIRARDFFTGFLSTALEDNELVTAVRFHQFPSRAAASVQELSRRHGDFALVGLACALALAEDGTVQDVSLAFLGMASTPVRALGAEEALVGYEPTEALLSKAADLVKEELDPPKDNHASASYRRHGAGVLTKRALDDCVHQLAQATTKEAVA